MITQPMALTVAGTDPCGGAGIQADLKTFAALGVYGFSAVAVVVAQNSSRVLGTAPMEPQMVGAQIGAVMMQLRPHAMKTGALAEPGIVAAVARAIEDFELPPPVVDPVLVSSSGARLLTEQGEAAMRRRLLPLAAVVTPNLPEAEALSGIKIDGLAAMREAARAIHRLGPRAVVIKGGHLGAQEQSVDLLFDGTRYVELAAQRCARHRKRILSGYRRPPGARRGVGRGGAQGQELRHPRNQVCLPTRRGPPSAGSLKGRRGLS
jgi:hydroxymethylpyrimidine/phosphomethylpyrimidine kinase